MKITINQTADDLDPNATTEDPAGSLRNYITTLTAALGKEFPAAEIEHREISDTYAFRVSNDDGGDDRGSISDTVQRIAEEIYETGNFWV